MRLTTQQLDFFDTFGFLKFPQLMADRLDWIVEEFGKSFPAKMVHDGTQRTCKAQFIDERLSALLDDPRILSIATSLMGDDFNYMGSDGNYYTGDTGWHRDGRDEKHLHVKIAFYLDPLDKDSGALRVIPGSHKLANTLGCDLDRDQRISNTEAFWGVDGSQVPAFPIDITPGDVVCFNHNIFHSSWGGSATRRMFTINTSERYPEEDLGELRDYIGGSARFFLDRAYGEPMMRTAPPERVIHLEQVMANDGHLAALSAKMRETMKEPARG